jgi:hypothetical protein
MPRIPDYEAAGVSVARANTPRFTPDRSRAIVAGGQEALIGAVGQAADQAVEHDDKLRYAAARATILKADSDARETLSNDADPYTYESRYRESLRKAKETAASGIRGSRSRALFEAGIDADIERGAGQIKEIARERIAVNGRATLQSTLDTALRTGLDAKDDATSVASIQTANTSIAAARESGFIDPVTAEKLRQSFRDDYAEGRVTTLPLDKRIEMLSNPAGTVAEAIQADKRTRLLERAREEKRVLEAREQALEDRREAKGERALAQLELQIASGVPISDELGSRWAKAVKGTSVEPEFKQAQKSEAEVQSMLRKPVGEQLSFIQEREAALLKGGGSTRDVANLNRLKSAVQQNVKLLQQAPLLYLQNRTDEEFAPLDFNALAGGDPEQGALLDDRVAALQGARQRVGAEVPLRPLLPQEAQQLGAALQAAAPKDQAQLFASLYKNFRDPKAYQGAMQQIAPDAPVKALAGILAGKQAELTTKTHWFSADETVSSVNVAQTLLEGESILDPGKAEKAQDGKPKLGLYLPDQTLLQQSFQEAVGDAFRGRAGAAELAYQGVQAYYVGRAAQTGRIATSKQDVDTNLVRESVTAVLGSVSDFNGAGKVLAPWGMDKDTFEERAAQEFRIEGSRRGIPKERIDQLAGDIGLQNAGANRYRVTVGNNFLLDRGGNPLLIEVPEDHQTPDFLKPGFKPYPRQ